MCIVRKMRPQSSAVGAVQETTMVDDQFKRMSEDDDYQVEANESGEDANDGFEEEEEVTISVTSDDDDLELDGDSEPGTSASNSMIAYQPPTGGRATATKPASKSTPAKKAAPA